VERKLFAWITETCASCGAHNRWWMSKLPVDDEKIIFWLETGLCPKEV